MPQLEGTVEYINMVTGGFQKHVTYRLSCVSLSIMVDFVSAREEQRSNNVSRPAMGRHLGVHSHWATSSFTAGFST